MPNAFKRYLSTPYAAIACFVFGIAARMCLIRLYLFIGTDKAALLLITRNFLHGHGISVDKVAITDLSHKFYEPFIGWPPGYTWLLSPFLYFFEDNFMLGCYLLDTVVVIMFFWYVRKLLLLIGFPVWLANLFMVWQGLLINDYFLTSNPTDNMGLVFCLAGLYHLIKTTVTPSAKQALAAALFFIMASLMRYPYMPVTITITGVFIITGMLQRKKAQIRLGLMMAGLLVIAFSTVLMYQKMSSGSSFYLQAAEKGFYPGNVLSMYPFIPAAFMNIVFYSMQVSLFFKTAFRDATKIAVWINWPVMIGLLAAFIYYVRKIRLKVSDHQTAYWLYGGIGSIVSVGLLVLLSVTNSVDVGPPLFKWTYVVNGRYYALPIVFLQIFVWWWLFVKGVQPVSFFKRMVKWVMVVLFAVEVLHSMYFIAKKLSKPVMPFHDILLKQPKLDFTVRFIKQQQQKQDAPVVVTSLDLVFGYIANWYGAQGFFAPLQLNQQHPQSTKPVVLLVAIRKNELFLYQSFLQRPGVRFLQTVQDCDFYTLYVSPADTP